MEIFPIYTVIISTDTGITAWDGAKTGLHLVCFLRAWGYQDSLGGLCLLSQLASFLILENMGPGGPAPGGHRARPHHARRPGQRGQRNFAKVSN